MIIFPSFVFLLFVVAVLEQDETMITHNKLPTTSSIITWCLLARFHAPLFVSANKFAFLKS